MNDSKPLLRTDGDYKRVHFISDFEVYGLSHDPQLFECQRCGSELLGEQACYDHRQGILSECRLARLHNWLDARRRSK